MPEIKIEGMDRLVATLGRLEGARYMRGVLEAGGSMLKNYIAEYPPASEANRPGQRRWYERGYGSRWTRRDGSVGGSATSQTLGRRWTVSSRGLTVTVGNNVTYGPFVQGDKQAAFHERRGWRTEQQAIEKIGPDIIGMAHDEIDRVLEGR